MCVCRWVKERAREPENETNVEKCKKLINLGKNRWDSYLGKNTILASSLIMNFRIKTKMNKFMYCSPRPQYLRM